MQYTFYPLQDLILIGVIEVITVQKAVGRVCLYNGWSTSLMKRWLRPYHWIEIEMWSISLSKNFIFSNKSNFRALTGNRVFEATSKIVTTVKNI